MGLAHARLMIEINGVVFILFTNMQAATLGPPRLALRGTREDNRVVTVVAGLVATVTVRHHRQLLLLSLLERRPPLTSQLLRLGNVGGRHFLGNIVAVFCGDLVSLGCRKV